MTRYEALEEFYRAHPKTWLDALLRWAYKKHGLWAMPFKAAEGKRLQKATEVLRELDKNDKAPYADIMKAMENETGVKTLKPVAEKYRRRIRPLWARGVKVEDFARVFAFKYEEYKDNAEWRSKVLNADTLLGKFEKYLGQADNSKRERPSLFRANDGE